MNRKTLLILIAVFVSAVAVSLIIYNYNSDNSLRDELFCTQAVKRDLSNILHRKKLVAVIDFSPTNYFVYKGIPMGFHYDLLKSFTNELGISLEVKVETDIEKMIEMLESGEVDIIAMDMAVTLRRRERVAFSKPHFISRQVLVQRLPEGHQNMSSRETESRLVRNLLDLRGKEVFVPDKSAYYTRLKSLEEEIGGRINIVSIPAMGVEQLIDMVARGDIDYTVCDEHLASVEMSYYHNLDMRTPISFEQELAWALRHSSPKLLDTLNSWKESFMKSRRFAFYVKKYYESSRSSYLMRADFHSGRGGKISEYDDLIRKHAQTIDWDWRLLAGLISQESNFKHELTSWAGAWGLMQLMPLTSIRFGADSFATPEENIRAGVNFINWIDNRLSPKIPTQERVKFVLAAYNVGLGHVFDAQRLARKYGKDPYKWEENTALLLELKSLPAYYLDPVVKSGFCRGKDVNAFVNNVLTRYKHYLNVVDE